LPNKIYWNLRMPQEYLICFVALCGILTLVIIIDIIFG